MTWPTKRARYLFQRREVRGADAPLASATKDGVTLRADLDQGVWNPGDDVGGYKLVEPDDFVIGLRSFQHGLSHSTVRGVVSPAYTVLRRRSSDLEPRFFAHYFRSAALVTALENLSQGIRQGRTIPFDGFADLPLPLPPLAEQRRIADFLDDQVALLDRATDLRKRQVSLLHEHRISAARVGTTLGLDHPRLVPTGVAWMPEMAEGWSLFKVGQVFATGSGTTPRSDNPLYFDGEHPWINSSDLRDNLIVDVPRSVTDAALADYTALKFYDPGALVVAMYGATIGRLGRLAIPACVNQACCVLHRPTCVTPHYAYYWFLGHRDEIVRLASGGGQPNISQEVVRNLRVSAPNPQHQANIVRELIHADESNDRLKALLNRQMDLVSERKRALITAAVTGQFDVTTARRVA